MENTFATTDPLPVSETGRLPRKSLMVHVALGLAAALAVSLLPLRLPGAEPWLPAAAILLSLASAGMSIGQSMRMRIFHARYRELRERLMEELHDARTQAQAGEVARRRILSNMNHEFRTPINAIIGYASLLRADEPEPERASALEGMEKSGWKLLRLVNTIVRAAEVDESSREPVLEEFTLSGLLVGAGEEFREEIEGKELRLVLDCATRRAYRGDREAMAELLSELVGNAVKFTERGSVTLSARELAQVDGDRAMVEIRIADTGPGMSPELAEQPREALVQGEEPLTKSHEGLGMGLYLAKSLADLLGGALRFESAPGLGTTVFCVIPFSLATEKEEES